MLVLSFQIPPPPAGSIDPFVGWLLALVLGGAATAIAIMWRQAVAESTRKDELIDRLLQAEDKNADTNRRSVSLLQEGRRRER